ncbi:hypothetical protein DPEC_G00271530 [Dallia pectoralis]|uniref:Uncharacterized protein n=1 Tax=Dallia pectoralis TaxID=75939 RepID=A0ACC2FPT0_DALPE|nr:hypothetical protein DPEC_G00271530 [Dallia pectoralis]
MPALLLKRHWILMRTSGGARWIGSRNSTSTPVPEPHVGIRDWGPGGRERRQWPGAQIDTTLNNDSPGAPDRASATQPAMMAVAQLRLWMWEHEA